MNVDTKEAQILQEIAEFLLEMSGQVPYNLRTIKGSEARQKEAIRLLALLKGVQP